MALPAWKYRGVSTVQSTVYSRTTWVFALHAGLLMCKTPHPASSWLGLLP